MAKLITKRKFYANIPQIISTLLIVLMLFISDKEISIELKLIIYLGCFYLNWKLIEICLNGYQKEIKIENWKKRGG